MNRPQTLEEIFAEETAKLRTELSKVTRSVSRTMEEGETVLKHVNDAAEHGKAAFQGAKAIGLGVLTGLARRRFK